VLPARRVGAAAAELQPLHDHLLAQLKISPKLFCDETRLPVLDPGRGKTKTGFLWALARDDRPWAGSLHSGSGPPAVVYAYAPGRGAEHAIKLLDGFSGAAAPPCGRLRPLLRGRSLWPEHGPRLHRLRSNCWRKSHDY
jgi:Transposase IS66 family